MQCVDHRIGIRETVRVKLMVTPFVYGPVLPVEHNVVKRYLPLPVLHDNIKKFLLVGVTLTALPESHCPFRHHRGLACYGAVTADDLIHALAADEVIVNLVSHLGPE